VALHCLGWLVFSLGFRLAFGGKNLLFTLPALGEKHKFLVSDLRGSQCVGSEEGKSQPVILGSIGGEGRSETRGSLRV